MDSSLIDELDCVFAAIGGLDDHGFGGGIELGDGSMDGGDDILCAPAQRTQKQKGERYPDNVVHDGAFHFPVSLRLDRNLLPAQANSLTQSSGFAPGGVRGSAIRVSLGTKKARLWPGLGKSDFANS
jgi:hypothetical protein